MQPFDSTALLPVEILLEILGNLCLEEFRQLMTVSRRWRDLVTCHPTFWLAPQLDSTSPSAVAFFLRRISAGAGKPINVTVMLLEPTALLEANVFPAIATLLDFIVSLTLHVHISHASAVFDLLRGPASSLRTLEVFFHSKDAPSPVWLPEDILRLHCHPQGLESVLLQNIDLPNAVPPALSAAKNLIYSQQLMTSFTGLKALADAFPHVRDLTLTGRVLPRDFTYSDWPRPWEYLQSLVIATGKRRLRKILSMVPLASVMHLTTVYTGRQALSFILPHLQGDLHMAFQRLADDDFAIHLASWTGLARSFREHQSAWTSADSLPHDVLRRPTIAERVISMTIAVTLWDLLVPLMVPFPRLEALTIALSSDAGHALLLGDPSEDNSALVCPKLQILTLDARDGAPPVPLEDVKRIIIDRIRVPTPVDLVMRWVNWHGSTDLRPVVNTVSDGSDSLWLYPATPWHSH